MKLALSKIVLDETLRARSRLDPVNVHRLITAYQAGARFPKLVVERMTNRLVDGWHRYEAYRTLNIAEVEVVLRVYASEAEFFADAVRLNIGHGTQLAAYDVKNAIARLDGLGISRAQIAEIVRIPAVKIDEIVRGFAHDAAGEPVPLKRGLAHLRGTTLNDRQIGALRHHGGHEASYWARQLVSLLEQDLAPRDNPSFTEAMNTLVRLWTGKRTAA
jgi:hypothetical protein